MSSQKIFFDFKPKDRWYQEDIENIANEVIKRCQAINPEIKLGGKN